MSREQKAVELIEIVKSLMKSDTDLRPSQVKALRQFTDGEEASYRGIFNLATGVGKTRVMCMLALAYLHNNPDSQVVVGIPSMELFQQEMNEFQNYKDFQDKQREKLKFPALSVPEHLDMGVFNQFDKNITSRIIFTTYQSLEKLSQRMDTSNVGLLLLDEAHHVVSERRTSAINSFTNAILYGMTATPWYSPERDARSVLGDILAKVDIVDAIKEADLAEFKNILMVSNLSVDLSKVGKDNTGDYEEKEFCKAILQAMRGNSVNSGNEENWGEAHHYIAKEVAKFYHEHADEHVGILNGKKCLINCRSQEEARIQAQELNKLFGRMVARVHTSDECDSQTIQDFVNGDLPIVCQVGKLTEGFDMPNLDMTINYPTASFVREAQGAARCIRLPKTEAPMIPPKKMGLVVDIAFKHPAYDNIVDAIRHNKQILFQDVVGTPFVQHDNKELQVEEKPEDELINFRGRGVVSSVERVNFTIISNAQELIRLQREADELAQERYVPPIRQGMRTSTDFNEEFGVNVTQAKRWLEECIGKEFYLKSDTKKEHPLDLVEWIKSRGHPCLALHEAPEALAAFMKMYPEIKKSLENKDSPTIRPGMRTSTDLKKEFGVDPTRAKGWLEACHGVQFYLKSDTKHEYPLDLVEQVRSGKKPCLALHEAPEALEKFITMHPEIKKSLEKREVPPIRPGMRTSGNSTKEFGIHSVRMKNWLEECIGKKFYLDSDTKHEHPLDLVEWVKSGSTPCWALHEAPEALKAFIKMHPEIQKSLDNKDTPVIRPGMRTSLDFRKEFGTDCKRVKGWLEECAGAQFYLESDTKHEHPLDLVEWVKSGSMCCLALHEAPEALAAFIKMHPEINKSLDTKATPPIREGMRTSTDFKEEFGVDIRLIRKCLKECIGKKFYRDSDTKKEHPLDLVEWVKSKSQLCWALHEAPEALKAFVEMNPELKKSLENKDVPAIRFGMRTSIDFKKEFVCDHVRMRKWLEECIGKKFYLDSDTKQEHPLDLVERVKSSGNCCLALHEAPEALVSFKEWLQKTHGKELRKRTSSPTLPKRLEAGSTEGQPIIPSLIKHNTPEI